LDIWAFGCVLFEMLTGRGVFEGETVSEILAEVLKSEPDWNRLPGETPESIRRLLRRCLRKVLESAITKTRLSKSWPTTGMAITRTSIHSRKRKRVFVEQLSGTLLTVAKDVKLQIEFNPATDL